MTYPGGSTETLTFNPAGDLTEVVTRAAQTLGFGYDALHRLTLRDRTYGDITYGYDLSGLPTAVADTETGLSLAYTYDGAGRLNTVTDEAGRVVDYDWDANGNLLQLKWPDAFFVTWTYDNLNRPNQVKQSGSTVLADYDWDALSRLSQYCTGAACLGTPPTRTVYTL